MVFPEQVPVFVKDDILIDENEYEYGEKRTTIGWLKHLFLFSQPNPNNDTYLWITEEDRRDYKIALDTLKKCGTMKDVADWEDRATAKTQATTLNKAMRKLGYTEIEVIE